MALRMDLSSLSIDPHNIILFMRGNEVTEKIPNGWDNLTPHQDTIFFDCNGTCGNAEVIELIEGNQFKIKKLEHL